MTKKDYELLAAALRFSKPVEEDLPAMDMPSTMDVIQQWKQDVTAIADALERDNDKFDCTRFFAACGMINGVTPKITPMYEGNTDHWHD